MNNVHLIKKIIFLDPYLLQIGKTKKHGGLGGKQQYTLVSSTALELKRTHMLSINY